MSSSIDEFPFVGAVPHHGGHFLAAGFTGHGSFPIPYLLAEETNNFI